MHLIYYLTIQRKVTLSFPFPLYFLLQAVYREIKQMVQGHTASEWQGWVNPGGVALESPSS